MVLAHRTARKQLLVAKLFYQTTFSHLHIQLQKLPNGVVAETNTLKSESVPKTDTYAMHGRCGLINPEIGGGTPPPPVLTVGHQSEVVVTIRST